ncbi:hypothetical protein EES38_08610 [Vibrio viridaestus]|uniref:Uncharacterized protein n=1 Tax=Vibrio viridaestus TaxID=2487322 RepID=A0A3N9TID9_9VIBR|nr:hypothetical protein EES38_08610 [Vibrio viridaestus]
MPDIFFFALFADRAKVTKAIMVLCLVQFAVICCCLLSWGVALFTGGLYDYITSHFQISIQACAVVFLQPYLIAHYLQFYVINQSNKNNSNQIRVH